MRTILDFLNQLPTSSSLEARPRPYFNHSVQFKRPTTTEERLAALESAGLNVFYFPAELITGCDMLSDSGTTTMTAEQWAALHMGDESYGSNKGYFLLMQRIGELFGSDFVQEQRFTVPNAFLFHQGRPAEDALFGVLSTLGSDLIIPSNGHFDTTQANIEGNGIEARTLFSPKLHDETETYFKGDMDTDNLRALLQSSSKRIPIIFLTITNNTGGGQPVSMANIKAVAALAHDFSIPLFFDACRFAENAWFIKKYEKGYQDMSIVDIVKEMFRYVDGFTVSFKKDGLVNMGGGLFLKKEGMFVKRYPSLPDKLMNVQIIKEAHPTYGGMSGRDIMTLVEGLAMVTKEEYLDARIGQVQAFGKAMQAAGLPVLMPTGGHAVYLDMEKFFGDTTMKAEDFGGISFTALLLGLYGHRACELGDFAFGHVDGTGKEVQHAINFVRFAIPRLRYEWQDLQSVVDAVKVLYDNRKVIPKIDVTYGRTLPLRHFKARFAFKG
jgi:tryptophanase